jgi:hypothetical protein
MSDPRPPGSPKPSSGTEARPRPVSTPGKVITATRAQPIEEEKVALKERLTGGASDAALNAISIAKEAVADFKSADKFFKYKAGIVAAWVALSVASLVIACPGSGLFGNNNLHARLVIAGEANAPIIMLVNEGRRPWTDVTVVVNKDFRAAAPNVKPHEEITLTPKQLMGPNNKLAPKDLHPTDVELRTARGQAVLMADGELK